MKIAFDTSTAAFEQKTGTGVYCEELVLAFGRKFQADNLTHSYRLSRAIRGRKFLLPLTGNSKRETLVEPWTYFNGYKYDIFHGLNSRLPRMAHCKMVATIHDLFSIYGEFSKSKFKKDQTEKLKIMIARADQIIVPASFTKSELVTKLDYPASQITVVAQGVRAAYLQGRSKEGSQKAVREKFGLDLPYLLFVGTLEKRKNLVGLIRTYRALAAILKPLPELVLVGHQGYLFSEIADEIEKSGLKNKIKILGYITEEYLANLYTGCEAFVYLSLEEGFGIPVIEAMACGAPVLTSDTTSLPEAGQGHSWTVGPFEYEKAAAILKSILERGPRVLENMESGKSYAKSQSWEKVAADTRKVYENLLQRPGE